jgi:Tol biopolymer transport system component
MKRILRIVLPAVLLLAAAVAVTAYFLMRPRVISFSPAADAAGQPGDIAVTVTFSTDIQPENLSQYLVFEPNTTGVYQAIGPTLIFTPSVPWGQDAAVNVSLLPGLKAKNGVKLASGSEWTFTTRHPWLTFQLDETDGSHLYMVDPSGLNVLPLIPGGASVLDYSITAAGEVLYSEKTAAGSRLRLFDRDTALTTDLLNCGTASCTQPQLSPDGSLLVYRRTMVGSPASLWSAQIQEGRAVNPAVLGEPGHVTRDPSFSVSGWLAYYDETALAFEFFHPVSDQWVSFENGTGVTGSWSADGSRYTAPDIGYNQASGITPGYFSQLLTYLPDSGAREELTHDNRVEDVQPAYAPDGRQLVFARRFLNAQNWTPGRQIWSMYTDGTNIRPLTNLPVQNHTGFAWSPDSRYLAFLQFNTASYTGGRSLWLMNMDEGVRQEILVGAYNLAWLP